MRSLAEEKRGEEGRRSTVRARRRSRRRRWVRRTLIAIVALALLPLALTLIYRSPAVHPVSTLMARDLVMLRGYDRRWVPIEAVAPVLVASVTMSEDGQFCRHHGIDFGALNEAFGEFLEEGELRGASTIPMQTVKNLFLWHGRSYVRKALEAPLAVMFDAIVPKKRIMEIYLNIAEWGPGIYGIEAAAQHHFGRAAEKLGARQAALLAVTLPNPAARNPARPDASLNRLAAVIQRRAAQADSHLDCLLPHDRRRQ